MNLDNLIKGNEIAWNLIDTYLLRLRELYPEYEIFPSVSEPDFIIFRKKIGESKFDKFTVDIKTDIKVHYTQLYSISR